MGRNNKAAFTFISVFTRLFHTYIYFKDMRNTKLLEVFLMAVENFSETDPTFILSEVVLTYMAVNRYSLFFKIVTSSL